MQLFLLLLIAIAVQSGALLLQYRHYTYLTHPHDFAGLYALGSILLLQVAPTAVHHPALQWSSTYGLIWLTLTAGILAFNHRFPIPRAYLNRHKNSYFLSFTPTFTLVKVLDIFFQQTFLVTFILTLFGFYPHATIVTAITAVAFVAAHIPLTFIQKKVSCLHLLGAILFIGIVPFIILNLPGGFWLIWLLHYSFYVAIRLLMSTKAVRRSILGQDIEL